MPIYEYVCKKCGNLVEVFQKVSDPGPKTCEKCGGRLARVISNTNFQLKGGGWYKDLYSSAKPDSGSSEGEAKTEAKSEAKADKPAADAKPATTETKKPAATPGKEKKPAKKATG